MKIIEVNGEPAIVLPDSIIAALILKAGDTLIAIPDKGELKLSVDRSQAGRAGDQA